MVSFVQVRALVRFSLVPPPLRAGSVVMGLSDSICWIIWVEEFRECLIRDYS